MNKKEIIMICLIICFICSISAVSAVDADTDDTNDTILTIAQDNDAIDISNDLSSYSLPNTDETVLGEGEGSFTQLNDEINQEGVTEITLTQDYKFGSGDDAFATGIVISKDITIIGDGHTIDGDNQARIFNIAEGATVTLTGIKFVNGNAGALNGGAIYSDGTLHMTDCNFTDNYADRGGALYLSGSDGTITDCRFEDNNAAVNGGAIRIQGSNWRVYESTFNNNKAIDGRGGAIYLEESMSTIIDDCDFTSNFANINGGAVEWYKYAHDCSLINSRFTDNVANRSGGAVYWYGEHGTIKNVTFTNNRALGNVEAVNSFGINTTGGHGGAVMWTGADGTIDNCTFISNNASTNGGAIFMQGSVDGDCKNISISNIVCEDNYAGVNGGAVDWYKGAHNCILINATFTNNTANRSGGAVFWFGTNGTIRNATFKDNKALGNVMYENSFGINTTGGHGGAIMWTGADGTIDDCTLTNNNAKVNGGAIFMQGSTDGNCSNIRISNIVCEDNYAGVNGGAVDWYKGAHDCTLVNATFTNNTANRSGGAVFWFGKNGTIRNATFKDNKALGNVMYENSFGINTTGGHGGAIMWTGADGTIDDCTFTSNSAKVNGGAIFMQGSTDGNCSNIHISNIVCEDNFAGVNGGAVDWYKGAHDCILENATFENNTANRSGGALFWFGKNGTVRNATFVDNKALGNVMYENSFGVNTTGGHGGAIMWTGADGTVDDCTFTNNSAKVNGGAIFMQGSTEGNCSNIEISNVEFKDNFAGVNGGAVDWYKGASDCILENATFENNVANRSGGAVFWFGTNGTINNATFKDNRALGNVMYENSFGVNTTGGHGGAIMWTGAEGDINNCTFINNSAKVNGGAIFMQGSTEGNCSHIEIYNVEFKDNFAGVNGGAVDWYKGAHDCILENATFENNVANRSGGAVYWFGQNGTVRNAVFKNNTALGNVLYNDSYGNLTYGGHGGAIMWTGAEGDIDHCIFLNNSAKVNGGAIFTQGSRDGDVINNCSLIELYNVVFKDNFAGVNGGAVDWFKGAHDCILENATFENNVANRSGGAIFWFGTNGTVRNATFINNRALGNVMYEDSFGVNTTGGNGGAIMWTGAEGDIDNCTFINNSAKVNGGAIYMQGSTEGNCSSIELYNAVFKDNFAGVNGGAVDWHEGAHDCILENATFENNIANRSGGAVYWFGQNGTVRNAVFINNSALGNVLANDSYGRLTYGGHGGAIMWTGSNGRVLNSTFTLNNASKNGGAIYMQGSTEGDCSNITVDGSEFFDNYAGVNGGALDWYEGAHDSTLSNSIFVNNTANRSGGAVYWFGHDGTIVNSTFENNSALGNVLANDSYGRPTYGGHGGAIMWTGANGRVLNSTFTLNNATRNGGAIYMQGSTEGDCSNITVDGSEFFDNYAGINGGALDWYEGAHDSTLSNSIFVNNTAERSGGAVYWYGHNGTVLNSTFEDNRALGNVLYNNSYNVETYGGHGGAIMWTGADGAISDSTFINNTAVNHGGAIYLQGSADEDCENMTILRSSFDNNIAGGNGGAVGFYQDTQDSEMINCNFTNNTAKKNGGAIYWNGHNGTVADSRFVDNRATGENLQYNMTLTMDDLIIINGDQLPSSPQTGKLYVLDNSSGKTDVHYISYVYDNGTWIKLDEFTSDQKSASPTDWAIDQFFGGDGGSILWTGDLGHIDNCTFENSQSARRGGGAYMTGGDNITYSNCNFTNCTSGTNGGGIDWLAGANYGKLINCTFTDNEAARCAGAIYYDGDDGEIINVTIINSYAHGGDPDFTSRDGTVEYARWDSSHWDTNTTGGDGGAIMFTGHNNYVYNATVINCTSVGRGGAIFVQDCSNLTVVASTFKNNTALGTANNTFNNNSDPSSGVNKQLTGHGGAIAFDANASDCTISDSTFEMNDAVRNGGAIYFGTGAEDGIVRNSTFTNNTAQTGNGGSIYWNGIDGNIINSSFDNNHARFDGGAVYIEGNDCLFANSTLDNNTAGDDGGAIFWTGQHGKMYNITASNNSGISKSDALDESHSKGGTIIITGSDMDINTLVVTNSFANEEAGGLFLTGNNVNLTNIYFANCSASVDGSAQNKTKGGAMEIIGNNTRIINATIEDSLAIYGGGIYWSGNDGYAYNITSTNNTAIEDGGAMYITGDDCHIYASNFTDNVAGDDGGAIYWEGDHGILDGSSFAHNTGTSTGPSGSSTSKGGTISITGNNVDISNSNFTDSSTKNRGNENTGGAIFITGNDVDIDGCNFNNCTAEGADGGTIYIIGNRTVLKNSNVSDSTARAGGAIYIQGLNATILNSSFTNTSAKNANGYNAVNLGGAIYVKGNYATIEGSEFEASDAYDGGMIYLEGSYSKINGSSFTDGYAYHNGGVIYSTGSNSNVVDSNFTYNLAELSGGAIYWYGGSYSKYNTVDGCIFTNNTAHGNTSDTGITRGGGAIYWSENGEYGTVKNSKFYYNSVQSTIDWKVDGGAVLWDKSKHALVDNCIFVGNFVTTEGDTSGTSASSVWAQGGAMYLRPNANYTVRNCVFENCSSSKEAGALYIQGLTSGSAQMILLENSVFINNVAEANGNYNINGGGAIQIKQCINSIFNNLTFINNTANKGGALCVFDSVTNLVVTGANFTGNKADRGSAISASRSFTLNDAVLLENRATTTLLDLDFNRNTGSIDILMEGKDNRLNAMYVSGNGISVKCNNVTYWTDNNISVGQAAVTSSSQASRTSPVPEAGISITVEIFDGDNNKLHEGIYATDANGKIHLDIADILTEPYSLDDIYVKARLTNEDYYTMAEDTSRNKDVYINASALDTIFHRNTTVTANLTGPSGATLQSARGIISVYIDDVFKGNMTIENGEGSLENIITNATADTFFEAGNHTVFLKYWGDANYDEVNTTVSFNITKAQSNLTVTIDDMGYNLYMNFTIYDDWDDKAYWDANGTATVEFYSDVDPTVVVRFVDVEIVNGVGSIAVRDLLPRNYTIKTIYHDDNNYNSSVNITNYTLHQKEFAAVFIEVNAYDIMVNDTVYINVTIVPPEGYDVPGNVTLYLDNKGYNLTLTMGATNATAKFNASNLTEGIKKVIVFYEGSKLLGPAKGEADFRVHKYNTTLSANVTNITVIQNEIINITLLNDTTGVVSAIVDGKEYFGRIKNGTVSIELPQLPVGEYNVTLYYEGDNKYNNATNYTVFHVIQATPEIIIDVDNVTYGNETLIVVTLPEDATGNVTVKINDTYYVFDTQNLTDGKAILPGVVLPAGNYTVEATYNGNENYTVTTNSTNFTVYKAKPMLNITVEDIHYGEEANITVTVPDGVTGNITIKINGTDKNITLPIVDGKVNWTVGGFAVGNHVVIANYSGNANYTNAIVTDDFNVLQIGTVLDVDVHDVQVWDTEYINVTIKDAAGNIITNATGNVTIDIDGIEYTAEIKDGVARFNTSNLTVGHKVAWVFYDGDRNLTGNRSKAKFDVTQRDPKVNVTALNITVDQKGKITINIPANATGHVVLSGNFTENPIYVYDFTDGVAEVTVGDLAIGNYSVHIKYYGGALDNYTVAENDTAFTVGKINATVSIEADNVTYGNATTIVVTVPDAVTGNITLKLNDTAGRNVTLPIENGKVTWVVEGLAAGNYTVNVTYNGNDDYNINNTESAKFEVKKADPGLDFIVSGTVHENATVQIYINDEIHGKVVNVTVDGVLYPNVSVDEEFITQVLTEFKPYTIIVEYAGNENFTDARVEHTFTPSKVTNYAINVTAINITVGEDEIITVEVPDNVDDVVIWVDGQSYRNNSFTGNKATFNITGLKEGIYTVTATVNDTEFEHKNVTTLFTVNKTYPSINITVVNETSIYVNDTVKVIVTVPKDVTENVTIEINGMEFTNSTVNGNATFYIPQITFGNKTVVATYPGDDKYRFNSTTANFTVNKRKSQVNVTVDAGVVGDDTVINVTIPANAIGYVIVNVDGTNYTVNTTNGNGSISIKGLGNTTHTVHVTYIGDDQYLPSDNETTFGIAKANTTIAIAVESINYGESANITVTVENDATGYITIRIDNIRNITLPVVNGTVNWIVDNLAADNYTVYANYSGDAKYNKNETDKDFEVSQISPNIEIIEVISTAGENATIIVEIDPRVSENVTVTVNDKPYTAKVDERGIAVITTDVLDYGTYTVNASYAGDKNFTKDYDIYEFTTNQTDDYLINITASDINVGENTNITVNVPADATGKVIIELNGTNYTATISGGKAVLNNVSTLKEGVYNVTAYFGDDKYVNKTVQTRFAVSKVDTPIAITVINDTSILVNDTVKVVVTVPDDVTKNVTIEINGRSFTNSTVNGNATFYIPQITFGDKTVVATYPGDDKYRFNSTTANFTVHKRPSSVNVTVEASVVGSDVTISVEIPANATGYVIVNVDGTNYTVNTTGGVGSVAIKGLGNTTHTVNVTYIGDDQYLSSKNGTTFGIDKDNTTIAITVESIDYGQKANITVTVKDDAAGYITIRIDDIRNITLPVINGTVNWIVDDLAADNYTVYANYSGDGKYNKNETDKDFEVRQISPEIRVINVISKAGENATIIVEIDPRVSENITVHVDKDYSVKPVDGIAVITTDVLDYGTYTVNASYAGDKNFTKDYGIYEFTTNQTDDYLINITASDINVGENTNITVNVPADATGKVIIELNGTNYTATISGGKAILNNVSTLKEGVYNVTAYFGDTKYANRTVQTRFAVSKVDTPIAITVVNDTSILVGDTVKVIVTVPEDVTEDVTIEINGRNFTNSTVDGDATFYIPQITYGNKTVVATYPGDDKYRFNSTTAQFTVNKRESYDIIVNVTESVDVGDVAQVNVTLPANATGQVLVKVDGQNYTINLTQGKGSVDIKGLLNGTYPVEVTYLGDDQYSPRSNNTQEIKVNKVNSTVIVEVDNITLGDVAAVNITVITNATGNVTITIGDEYKKTVGVTDGVISVIVPGLTVGDKTVNVTYNGDDRFLPSSNSTNFTVGKTTAGINLVAQNITYGQDETIVAFVNATGNVTFRINGQDSETVNISDGKAVFTGTLNAGNYTVEAIYNGDTNTNSTSAKANFTVFKADPTVSVEVEDIVYGDVEYIIVHVNAEGNVTIKVNGTEISETISLENGEKDIILRATQYGDAINSDYEGNATLNVYNLPAGKYKVEVTYNGNDNFNKATVEDKFLVYKDNVTIDYEVEPSIPAGETQVINITLNNTNATGNVIIYIGGKKYTKSIDNGTANFTTPVLQSGVQGFVIVYEGDENFNKTLVYGSYIVEEVPSLKDISIGIGVESAIPVGETQVINIAMNETNATGNVIIYLDGEKYTRELVNGTANLTTPVLSSGNHSIVVIYEGDDIYNYNWTSETFEVTKLTPEIKLNTTLNGDTGIINVTAPKDVTGPVLVDVDGVGYYVNITDGEGQLILYNLTGGSHDVAARYLGDDNYTESDVVHDSIVVENLPSNVSVKVENITYGEDAVIEVTVPSDATGTVTVTVDGKPYEANVSGGKAIVVVPGLEAGNYTVDVTYNGDDKYNSSENSTKLEVSKAPTDDLIVVDQGNGTVVVVVPDNATGNVTVKVGNNTYTAEVINGTAVITLENETPGTHDIEVIYSGDENHEGTNATSTVTIPKLETPISVDVEDCKVGDTAIVTVNVPENATGNVTIEVDGVKYTEEIKDGKAVFNVTNLTDGNKTIAVDYPGDDNYLGNHTTGNFTVDKCTSTVEAEADPIDAGETAVITVTVPDDATGYVIVEIDNQTYAGKIENGTATVEIERLGGGEYPVNVIYPGDDKYAPSNSSTSLKVSKVPSTVNVTVEDITVGDKAVINVETPEDLCGNVTVSVDGENYTVFVSGGKGTLVVPDLDVGSHTVDVIFDGCKKYEPSNNTAQFNVNKVNTTEDDIKVIDQGNGTVVVVVPDNANGTVEIKVGNNTYNATVENGIATITLDNETPGTHEIEVIYSGDDTHEGTSTTSTVTIPKLETPISVDVDDCKVGDNAVITVNVPEDATGNVTIEVDGVKYTAEIKDGKAVFEVPALTDGTKTVAVEYPGDDNYIGNHTTGNFTVSKRESEVSATITDSNVGDNVTVTVTVPKDATGQVLIDIDGVGYYVNVTNGTGTVEIPRVPSGIYNVNVTYPGDDKYLPSSNSTTCKVSKVESFVIPKAEDIYVGDNEVITISVPSDATGNVTIVIDGEEYNFNLDDGTLTTSEDDGIYTVAVSGGNGKLVISGLPKGDYVVSAKYNGDDKYLPSTNTTTFKVLRKSSSMDVTDLGNGTVIVDLPENATGTVTVKVGNNTYNATVKDGKAVIDLSNETPGTHDIEVIYSGDSTHEPQTADSKVTIPKYNTPISVDVDDCKVGDTAVVTVNLPDDATGEVTIEINGKSYTAQIKDGKAVFNVDGLEAGDKTVAVKYAGDENYVGNSTTGQFTVSKRASTVKATSKDIKVGDDEVITVTVPKDATGRVLVNINGVGYYGTIVNGKAKVVIPELPSGKYTAKVTYEGDDKYLPSATTTTTFTVTKVKTPMKATGDEIEQGDDATVVVRLPSDATGTVTVTVDGKKYTAEVRDGKAVFKIPGLTKGDHEVTASYSGDKKYEANDTITDIEVNYHETPNGGDNVKHAGVDLTRHATGNPILVLLLVILAVGSTQIRRFRK